MSPRLTQHLITFLREELHLSQDAIYFIQRQEMTNLNHLPIVLWKFGLVSLPQVNRIFAWIEAYPAV